MVSHVYYIESLWETQTNTCPCIPKKHSDVELRYQGLLGLRDVSRVQGCRVQRFQAWGFRIWGSELRDFRLGIRR